MHRIDTADASAGAFVDQNDGTGFPGTAIDAAWANAVQEEIAGVIEAAGVTLAKGTNDQLASAVAPAVLQWGNTSLGVDKINFYWMCPCWLEAAVDSTQRPMPAPFDGVIRRLRVAIGSPHTQAVGDVASYRVELYKNGSATGLYADIAVGAFYADGANVEVAVADHDVLTVKVQGYGDIDAAAQNVVATVTLSVG